MSPENTDFLLIYPPAVMSGLNGPPLGIQHIAYYCRSKGYCGALYDLNISFVKHLLKNESLELLLSGVPEYSRTALELCAFLKIDESERLRKCRGLESILKAFPLSRPCANEAWVEFFIASDVWQNFLDSVKKAPARVIGISILSHSQLSCALAIAEILRNVTSATLVFGGSELAGWGSDKISDLLKSDFVDVVVLGAGEQAFENILQHKIVPKSVVSGRSIPLRELPIEASFLLNPQQYIAPHYFNVLESNGCYWNRCTHCDYISLHPDVDFGRPIDELVQHLEDVGTKSGVRRFHLINETLAPARARKLVETYISIQATFKWNCFVKIDRRFTKEILQLLPRGGCEFLIIGLESLSDNALSVLDKGYTADEAKAWLKDAKDAGVRLTLNLIVGIPGTNEEDDIETLRWLEENPEYSLNTKVYRFVLSRISGMGRNPQRYNIIPIKSNESSLGHRGGSSVSMSNEHEIDLRYSKFCHKLQLIRNRARRSTRLSSLLLRENFQIESSSESLDVLFSHTAAASLILDDPVKKVAVYESSTGITATLPEAYLPAVEQLVKKQRISISEFLNTPDRSSREDILLTLNEAGIITFETKVMRSS